jgi:hypothetical protein
VTNEDDVTLRIAERNELTRIAAARIIENEAMGRRHADPETLSWARAFVRMHKPLSRPLGTGAIGTPQPMGEVR